MHGRLKVKTSLEKEQEKILERKKKMKLFQAITADVFDKKLKNDYSIGLLNLTSEILCLIPDFYTLWNIRKKIFTKEKTNNKDEFENLMKKELNFLNECLKINPKSYSVWQQRCFIMQLTNEPDWKQELELTSKFLEYDDRNFHCWDYRRFIVDKSGESLESELMFSTKKITADFSNFSSWHYRGNLISQIYPNLFIDHAAVVLEEYRLVENALFTDPNDQSGWLHHRWLLTQKNKNVWLSSLLIDLKGGMIIIKFSSPLQHFDEFVSINQEKMNLNWRSITNKKFNTLFVAELKNVNNSEDLHFYIRLTSNKFLNGMINITCTLKESDSFLMLPNNYVNEEAMDTTTKEFLEKQLVSLQGLNEFEPDNKFTLHALIILMRKLDLIKNYKDVMKYLKNLMLLDSPRKLFYLDLESKLKIERRLREKSGSTRSIDLSHMSLTTLYYSHSMYSLKSINLSNNSLVKLNNAHYMQCVELLLLNNNKIQSCNELFNLSKLVILDLTSNCISQVDDLNALCSCPNLQTIILKDNPITLVPGYQKSVQKLLPYIKYFS